MAELIPRYSEADLQGLRSRAEASVYRAAQSYLGAHYLVLHGIEWILKSEGDEARDGEADFLFCSDRGLLIVEVKGGGVSFDPISDDWSSVDRQGIRNPIKDPFRQAKREKFAVLSKLKEHPGWTASRPGRILIGHAVLFADAYDVSSLVTPKSPRDILGSQSDLARLDAWIEGVFDYWHSEDGGDGVISAQDRAILKQIFARPLELRPLLSQHLAEEERERIRLTDQQARILSALGRHRRVAICGGAGTGKTMLALEKARRLAREGFRTLLLCYNRPLTDHLAAACQGTTRLELMDFHQLCVSRVQHASRISGRDLFAEAAKAYPLGDVYDVQWPMALALATDILPDRYDAVVIDEGQDFRQEYWLPIELLLADEQTSPLYVFYDQNQALYTRAATFPIRDEPYVLTTNCRNTQPIHHATYRYFRGDETAHSGIAGRAVERVCAPTPLGQAQMIHGVVSSMLTQEKIKPRDMVVLLGDRRLKKGYTAMIAGLPLPNGVRWSEQQYGRKNAVLIETVARFKGLESSVVFLWGLDTLSEEANREDLYVGLSRAKSILYLVANQSTCDRLLLSGTDLKT